jgi:hypothetical protein
MPWAFRCELLSAIGRTRVPGFTVNLSNPRLKAVQNGGVLSGAGGMTIGPLGTVRGNGTIVGNVLNYSGIVAPGASTGTLHIDGDYTQANGGKLQIKLASPTSFDRLDISGNISLDRSFTGGSTLQVSLADGYVPRGAPSFDILDWGGVLSGNFLSLLLPTLGETLKWDTSQLYINGRLSVTGPANLRGDFNRDGTINALDVDLLAADAARAVSLDLDLYDLNGDDDVTFVVSPPKTGESVQSWPLWPVISSGA